MAISLSLPAKSNISLSSESKYTGLTIDEADWALDDDTSILDLPKISLSREAKSNISLNNESK